MIEDLIYVRTYTFSQQQAMFGLNIRKNGLYGYGGFIWEIFNKYNIMKLHPHVISIGKYTICQGWLLMRKTDIMKIWKYHKVAKLMVFPLERNRHWKVIYSKYVKSSKLSPTTTFQTLTYPTSEKWQKRGSFYPHQVH